MNNLKQEPENQFPYLAVFLRSALGQDWQIIYQTNDWKLAIISSLTQVNWDTHLSKGSISHFVDMILSDIDSFLKKDLQLNDTALFNFGCDFSTSDIKLSGSEWLLQVKMLLKNYLLEHKK